jgi:hypothetical protein
VEKLLKKEHSIYPIGNKIRMFFNQEIEIDPSTFTDVDTLRMYVSIKSQTAHYEHIINLQARRLTFTLKRENLAYEAQLKSHGIQTEESCTWVVLATKIDYNSHTIVQIFT